METQTVGIMQLPVDLPVSIVPMDEIPLIDAAAVDLGFSLETLMENAGRVVAEEITRRFPTGSILVACGPGNNGGDGYVAARLLAQAGRSVAVWPVLQPRSHLCILMAERLPASVSRLNRAPDTSPSLIVDAILGAGSRGPLKEPIKEALLALSRLNVPTLAVDIPTGLDQEMELPRLHTVTFQVEKQELMDSCTPESLSVVDIGLPKAAIEQVSVQVFRRFPLLDANAHKGRNGETMVVGGGPFPGALHFACQAALRTGCDLVRAWTTDGPDLPPSLVVRRQQGHHLVSADTETLSVCLARAGAVLIGNGAGREPGVADALKQVFSLADEMGVPMVIDADGITLLANEIREHGPDRTPIILTPHQGELRFLLQGQTNQATIHAFARPNRLLLVKGRVDFISDGRRWQKNLLGNPRMAMGGTGDLLAGLTAGLIARGTRPFDACRIAVYWLTATGDELWQEQGPCYVTEDLIPRLGGTLRRLMTGLHLWPPLGSPI